MRLTMMSSNTTGVHRTSLWGLILLSVLVLAFSAGVAHGQSNQADGDDPCTVVGIHANERPNANSLPTEVSVGVRMVDLRSIDDLTQTLTVDLFVVQSWTDPRLVPWQGCTVALDSIWSPSLVFVNSGRLIESLPNIATIGAAGRVSYYQRYYGTLASYEDLRNFPFDRHVFDIGLVSFRWSAQDLTLAIDTKVTGRRELLDISDWTIGDVTAIVQEQTFEAFDSKFWTYDLMVPAERIWSYYVWKVILPIALIVAMSWCVFWIDPSHFGTQIGLSATSMLTLIAFIFATTNIIPRLGYFTTLDRYIMGSTILVFLALVQSVCTTYLVSKDKARTATIMDRVSRLLFPTVFAAFMLVLLTR